MGRILTAILSLSLTGFAFFFVASIAQILLNLVLVSHGLAPLSWFDSTVFWTVFFSFGYLVRKYG